MELQKRVKLKRDFFQRALKCSEKLLIQQVLKANFYHLRQLDCCLQYFFS